MKDRRRPDLRLVPPAKPAEDDPREPVYLILKPYTPPIAKALLIGGLLFYGILGWHYLGRFYVADWLIMLAKWMQK